MQNNIYVLGFSEIAHMLAYGPGLERYTPRLKFELDGGVKRSIEITRMLNEVLPSTLAEIQTVDKTVSAEQEKDSED